MQIIKSPDMYSSAFGDAVFDITASSTEIVEVDIYDRNMANVIGKKRFTGTNGCEVNVAGYARRQLDVQPLRPATTSFAIPQKRTAPVTIKSGIATAHVTLTAGLGDFGVFNKLSNAPHKVDIGLKHYWELTTFVQDESLTSRFSFIGTNRQKELVLETYTAIETLVSLCINMSDIAQRLAAAGGGDLADYHTMTVAITNNSNDKIIAQDFNIVPEHPGNVRLCWWNWHGQVDYCTLNEISRNRTVAKNRIYTSNGYKSMDSSGNMEMHLTSDHKDRRTMEWMSEIITSPAVWIDSSEGLIPVEIVSDKVTAGGNDLSKIELTMIYKTKQTFQNV